ncbi:M14 family zinc carboxypeptidase [Metabacillus lacus]|uniref:M14 family zinc carboxypeptidase n=1 Tax=Metabacillus lacus TaxID=1983721 RepID=UPI001FE6DD01|nr:M14 family zinc carboxypeptidase [Metabacillus lacus]
MFKKTAAIALSASLLLSISAYAPQPLLTVSAAQLQQKVERAQSLFNTEHYEYATNEQIHEKIKKIASSSDRVQLKTTGKTSTGKELYTVTISTDKNPEKAYSEFRKLSTKDPKKAQEYLKKNNVKAPILIHASIHGTEFVGADAALSLIERFAYEKDAETSAILKNFTLIFNVNANPDGRKEATRFNKNGIDLNRDFLTQSESETKAVVDQIVEWNPLVLLDLHGYVKQRGKSAHPGLILPGTPPHNPNYEYDLLHKWMIQQAEAMEKELVAQRNNYESELYTTMEGTHIPLRDSEAGWDDYPPIYTPMYNMLHGGYSYTLEAPTNDWDGVRWQIDAVNGALAFALQNKQKMQFDQLEIYNRGLSGVHPTHEKDFFPESYLIPVDERDPYAAHKAVQHLLKNDIEVSELKRSVSIQGKEYPKGTYHVSLRQAKAGLANSMLWEGEDISVKAPAMYDISAWNLPELWGFERTAVYENIHTPLSPVKKVKENGNVSGKGPYLIPNTSVGSVALVNKAIKAGAKVSRDSKGNFYVGSEFREQLKKLSKNVSLDIVTSAIPEDAVSVKNQKIAILRDGGLGKVQSHAGTRLALLQLGFEVTELHPRDVAQKGLNGYDIFIYSGSRSLLSYQLSEANKEFGLQNGAEYEAFKEQLKKFTAADGQFIAIGSGGSQAAEQLGLTDIKVTAGKSNSNGIVTVTNTNSLLSSGYKTSDAGFVFQPVWYSNTDGKEVAAYFENSDHFFTAGYWAEHSQAKGKPVIVKDNDRNVTLIGLEAGFRNHTEHLFRYLSNAIFTQ